MVAVIRRKDRVRTRPLHRTDCDNLGRILVNTVKLLVDKGSVAPLQKSIPTQRRRHGALNEL